MTQTRKAQSQTRQRLALSDLAKVLASNTSRHSTRPHVGRKPELHRQCPVCNSRGYLKALSVSLDGAVQRGEVCPSCHAAAAVSTAYGQSIGHRIAQAHHAKKDALPC